MTELVYGVDLVKEQIRAAAGDKLALKQDGVTMRGHAIEMRIYAEDPQANFVPSTGRVRQLVLPEGPGVRNENGIYPGYDIPIYYDPLIGKVIVWAEDRPTAINRARRAMEEYQIDGVKTNIEFLLWALAEPGFVDGSYDTGYIEERFAPNLLHGNGHEIEIAAIAASITAYKRFHRTTLGDNGADTDSAWRRAARLEGVRKLRA